MNDLISRKKLLKMMLHWKPYMDMGLVRQAVERMPTVDAVEVVRCEKCRHSDMIDTVRYCFKWERNTENDGYCHEGY